MALLFVFASVALLAGVAGGLHQSSLSDWRVARREVDRVRAEAVALSGLTMAEELLRIDTRPYFWFPREGEQARDSDGSPLPLSKLEEVYLLLSQTRDEPMLQDGLELTVEISDEAGRLNVNRAPGGNFRRLLQVLEVANTDVAQFVDKSDNEFYEELAASLEDWRDPDGAARPQGAESEVYSKREPYPYRPRNGPLLSVGELAHLQGFDPVVLHGGGEEGSSPLAPFLTVHGLLARVNANSATPEVLAATPGIFRSKLRPELVGALLQARPYRSRQEIQTVLASVDPVAAPVALPWLDVRSDYFRVTSRASVPGAARVELELVVRKLPGNRLQRVGYRQR